MVLLVGGLGISGAVACRGDVPEVLLTDPTVVDIRGFELYRNGLYWWRDGVSAGGFVQNGSVAYQAFVAPSLTQLTGSSLNRLSGGFKKGGSILATISLDSSRVATGHYLVRDDSSVGREAVRDEAFAYYVRGGVVRRKALHLKPGDPDQVVTRFNAGGPPFTVSVSGQGVSHVEGGKITYWGTSGGDVVVSRVGLGGADVRETMATFPGTGVRKFLVTDVLDRAGASAGRYLFVLTDDRKLYRVPFQPGASAFLVSSGISDFTVRDEQVPSGSPFLLYDWVTRVYAGTFDLTGTVTGRVWGIDGLTLAADVVFDTGRVTEQVDSVACDGERLFASVSKLACGGLGCNETGAGDLWSKLQPVDYRLGGGNWGTIAFEGGRNLRSNGQWVYFIKGNRIKKLRSDAPALALNLRARGLEVVQVVQDLNNSVPLVAGKATTVRGYADVTVNTTGFLGPAFSPPARVRVWHGLSFMGEVAASNSPKITQNLPLGSARADVKLSYLFDIPPGWVRAGQMNFFFDLDPNHSQHETDANWAEDNVVQASLTCVAKQRPALVMARMASQLGTYEHGAAGSGFWDIIHRGESLLPVDGFRVVVRGGEVTKPVVRAVIGVPPVEVVGRHFEMPGDQKLGMLWLAVAHALDKLPPGSEGDRHYVGMFPRGIPSFNGLGGIANRSISELLPELPGILEPVVGDFVLPPNAYSYSLIMRMDPGKRRGSDPAWFAPVGGHTLAHELGHNYGRFHIPYGPDQFPDGPYDGLPFDYAHFGPKDIGNPANAMGFDWLTCSAIAPDAGGDLMSYAPLRWPSRQTYLAIMNQIPDAPAAGGLVAGKVAKGKKGAKGAGGEVGGGGAGVLVVQGSVTADYRAAVVGPAYLLPEGEYDAGTAAGFAEVTAGLGEAFPMRLRQVGGAGEVLDEVALLPNEQHGVDGTEGVQFLNLLEPKAGTARLEVVVGGVVVGRLAVSANAPVVVLDPVVVEGGQAELSWGGGDADGDVLFFVLQYSRDGGESWETLAANGGSTSAVVDTARLAGGDEACFRVLASDGYHTAMATSEAVVIARKAPVCSIQGLVDGERLAYGEMRALRGVAEDAEDGRVEELTWVIGGASRVFEQSWSGGTLVLEGLAPGVYVLALYGTDSDGETGVTSVSFEVLPFAIPETGVVPVLDGVCGDATYGESPVMRIAHGDGTHATVRMAHRDEGGGAGSLYLCFSGLRYGENGSPGATAGLQVDVDASGGATAQLGDVGFFVDENGVPWQTEGDGDGMVVREVPAGGVDVVVVRNETSWGVEMCVPDGLLGGWGHGAGFVLCHDRVDGDAAYGAWPPGAVAGEPGSWTAGVMGPPEVSVNAAPVADAGVSRTVVVSRGDTVRLDGSGSYDVDGDALSYAWVQLSGPAVGLSGADTAAPWFAVPGAVPGTELVFGLTVNDGLEDSAEVGEVRVRLREVVGQPVELAAEVTGDPGEGGLAVVLECNAVAGECVEVQSSEDMVEWEALAVAAVDLFGRVSYPDVRPVPESGRRFYRAVRCGVAEGYALSFEDDEAEVVVGHAEELNTYPMTVSFWMKTSVNDPAVRGVVNKYVDASLNGFSIGLYQGVIYAWYFHNGSNFVYVPVANRGVWGGFVADGEWHHVGLVIDATGGTFYVDGEQRERLAWTGTPGAPTTGAALQFGKYAGYPVSFLGEIDSISLWGVALTEAELAALALGESPGSGDGLIGSWPCDDLPLGVLRDVSGGGHDGVVTGGVRKVASSVPRGEP